MTIQGLDFAWSKPSVSAIQAGGYKFVLRYHSYDTTGKNLTKAEADSYRAAGIFVCSNWEYATGAPLNGFDQGVADATEGLKQKLACGGDPKAPIYFSLDENSPASAQPAINAYYQGCSSVLGSVDLVGIYGGYQQVKRTLDAGVAKWGWQTYAWSRVVDLGAGPANDPHSIVVNLRGEDFYFDTRAQLRQVHNGVNVGGADCDENQAQVANYGQWYYEGGNERIEDMPAIIAKDPAGSIVLVYTTEDGIVWNNIVRPETEAAWLAATGAPAATVPTVGDLGPEAHAAAQARSDRDAAAIAKALKDAGIGTGSGDGGGGSMPDHTHDVPAGTTGPAVTP